MSNGPNHADQAGAGFGPYLCARPVPARLSGLVHSITGYAEGGVALCASLQPATLVVPFIITFADAFHIGIGRNSAGQAWTSFTAGLFSGPVEISSAGRSQCIQVDFTPLGARRFFGVPMSEITNRMVSLDDIDPEFRRLRERLFDAPTWHEKLAIVETFVTDRLTRRPSGRKEVARALDIIVASGGNVRIGQMAADLNISVKHMAELFRDHVGLGAKTVARIARFNAAAEEAAAARAPDWAGIAAGCGYADQAHLSREFLAFSGCSPTEWAMSTTR